MTRVKTLIGQFSKEIEGRQVLKLPVAAPHYHLRRPTRRAGFLHCLDDFRLRPEIIDTQTFCLRKWTRAVCGFHPLSLLPFSYITPYFT